MRTTSTFTPRISRTRRPFRLPTVPDTADGMPPEWNDNVQRAMRQAAWRRRRTARHASGTYGQRIGFAGAVLMLVLLLLPLGTGSNPLARADAKHKAEQQAPAPTTVDTSPSVAHAPHAPQRIML